MKVLCTVKRIIDPDVKAKLTASGALDTGNVDYKLNPFDEYGIEEAVRLKEKGVASEVVVLCVGSSDAEKEIRTALAMGADRGILVKVDDPYEGLDMLGVARLLAEVIKKEAPQVVIMGKLSVDTEGNTVGQMLAELLGWGQATFAYKLDIEGNSAMVGREVDGGTASVKVALPAIVTADLRLNEPRYATLPGIMKAKKKPLDTIDASDLDADIEQKVTTLGYELPPARKAGEFVADVDTLFNKLKSEAKVI
jgi:electron transfer flavoprotein beta subunit